MIPRVRSTLLGRGRVTRRGLLLGAVCLPAVLAACGGPPDPNQPPNIRLGQDVCVNCGMIISDPAYTAAYTLANGEARLFDDLGELVRYHREHRETVHCFFVRDVERKTWIQTTDGTYLVLSPRIKTPMATGLVAVGNEAEARALAERTGGTVFTWAELSLASGGAMLHHHGATP